MSGMDTRALIQQAIERFQTEVPALAGLKIILGLELRGRGDVQMYRVELPGPVITKDTAPDSKVRLEVQRADFNHLAVEGTTRSWRQTFEAGNAKASGQEQIIKLIRNVVERHDERAKLSKLSKPAG